MTNKKFFPSQNEKLITGIVIALIVGLLIGLATVNNDKFLTVILPALATLVAAFVGAWYAFKLNREKDREDIRKKNIAAGNFALFTFNRIFNHLFSYKKQIINPYIDNPFRFIHMQATLGTRHDDMSLDLPGLSFLLESEQHMNLLGEITAFESRFRGTMEAINERSRRHVHEIQPLMEAGGIRIGIEHTYQDLLKAMGERLVATMENYTDTIINNVEKDLIDVRKISLELHYALKSIFPDNKFIRMGEIPEL